MALTKVSLIQDGVIVVGHLHTNHGITTDHIGEGSSLYFTDARVMTSLGSISTSIIPDTDITYDLGSATNRFRDLYLSGNTIHLGGDTKISVNNDGEVEFKDSSDAPKRLKVKELDFVDDQGRNKRFKIDATSGRLATFDASGTLTADKLDLSAMSTSDLSEGTNLYYTDARVGSYLSTNGYDTATNIIALITDSAPTTLNTLNELAAALGDDPNFAGTISGQIGAKWTQDNTKISNWDTAYGWGDHASAGYLTSFTETDPTVPSHVKSISTTDISNWNTAYGWGNHSGLYLPISGKAANSNLLDGIDSGSFLRSDANDNYNSYTTSYYTRYNVKDGSFIASAGDNGRFPLQIYAQNGTDAAIAFHIGGDYAGYFGLDAANNDLFWGGWSVGSTTKHRIWHSGNDGSGSGLDADTVDGYHASGLLIKSQPIFDSSIADDTSGPLEFSRDNGWDDYIIKHGSGKGFFSKKGFAWHMNSDSTFHVLSSGWTANFGVDHGGTAIAAGSFRAPIFYDYNNTGYYFHGDATTNLNALTVNGTFKVVNGVINMNNNDGFVYDDGANVMKVKYDGTEYPIWTSANDGSGSGLDADLLDGQQGSAYIKENEDRRYKAIRFTGEGGNSSNSVINYGIYQEGGAWSSPFPDLVIGYHTGIKIGGYKNYNGTRFYNDAPGRSGASMILSVGDGSDNVVATNSFRAPIFYDSNNTGYYVDPASTSNFNGITSQGESNFRTKRHYFGLSNNWDAVGVSAQTNVHFQGHNQFWVGAGNGTWFTGTANSKSSTSGLSADATYAHDLLITTMQSTSAYDRGITFAVDNAGNANSGWRLGKWHAGDAQDASKLTVDGGLFVKGGYTDEFEYYADDYSAYHSSQGGTSYWTGGTNAPSITASTAIQIQSGNKDTNTRNPQLQFHQYGYGGVQFRYDGPNDRMYLEPLGTNRFDWYRNQTDHGYIDFGPANTGHAHIYTDRANFYFNKQLTVSGGSQINSGDIRAGVLYDINDTNVRLDSTRLVLRGTDPTVIFRDTDHTSAMWHVNSHKMYLLRGNGDTESWTQVSGQWPVYWDLGNNNAYFGGTVVATNAVTAPIFYDSNNTSYYVDPNTSGTSINVRGVIQNPSVWINDGDNYGGYSENIRLFTPTANSGSPCVIAFGASGTSGTPVSSILGYSDRLEQRWGGTWQERVYNGYVVANGSYRAPVFYDSNNTAYYTNPASTSRMNQIDANYLDVVSGAAYALRFWGGSNNYSIRMSQSGDGTYGGRVAGETTSDYNMYFTMAAGTNRGFVFNNGLNNAIAGIDASGVGRFTGAVHTPFIQINKTSQYGSGMDLTFSGSNSTGILIRNNTGATTQAINFFYSSAPQGARGSITVSSTSTSYNTSSDYRLKENIVEITDGIERVKLLEPKRFNFIGDDKVVDGFVAHETQEVVPEAVTGTKDAVDEEGNPEYQGIDQGKLVPLLTAALQEAIAKIEDLEARIQTLEGQ